ncbi:MAG: hypothetical protein ACI8UO_005547 [Verrucomicrobiales bacterium]|jgi:uncharacterized protein with beta-barrel porin domain
MVSTSLKKIAVGSLTAVTIFGSVSIATANPIPAAPGPIAHFAPDSSIANNQRMFRTASAYRDEGLGSKVMRAVVSGQYASHSGGETDYTQFGGAVGLEFGATDVFRLGVAFNYVDSELTQSAFGSTDINGLGFSVYGLIDAPVFKAKFGYSRMGYGDYPLHDSGLGAKVLARSDSVVNHLEFDGALDIGVGGITTGPIFGARYNSGVLDEFGGTDVDGLALHSPESEYKSLITHLGWQIGVDIPVGIGRISPLLRVAWEHEFIDDQRQGSPELSSLSGLRTLSGSDSTALDNSWLTVGAGVEIATRSNFTLGAGYDTYFALDTPAEQFWSVNGSVAF